MLKNIGERIVMAVVAYEGVRPFQLCVPCEVFGEKHCEGVDAELWVCSIESGPVRTNAGFAIDTSHKLDNALEAHVIFIPSWQLSYRPPPRHLVDTLIAAHAKGAIIVGLCLGAYVLAETGCSMASAQRPIGHSLMIFVGAFPA